MHAKQLVTPEFRTPQTTRETLIKFSAFHSVIV
jgi:hypothetical protein